MPVTAPSPGRLVAVSALDRTNLGPGTRRRPVLGLEVEHVPDRLDARPTRERRRLAVHPAKIKPELVADAPHGCGPVKSSNCATRCTSAKDRAALTGRYGGPLGQGRRGRGGDRSACVRGRRGVDVGDRLTGDSLGRSETPTPSGVVDTPPMKRSEVTMSCRSPESDVIDGIGPLSMLRRCRSRCLDDQFQGVPVRRGAR